VRLQEGWNREWKTPGCLQEWW